MTSVYWVAGGAIALLLVIWAALVAWRRRTVTEVSRNASWSVQMAESIVVDVTRAVVLPNDPALRSRAGQAQRHLANLALQATSTHGKYEALLGNIPQLGTFELAREARELRGAVLRLVLARAQTDAALRELSNPVSTPRATGNSSLPSLH